MKPESLSSIPDTLRHLFAHPPLLPYEDHNRYSQLFEMLREKFRPTDPVAWLLLKDFLDYEWEALRMRHMKSLLAAIEGQRAVSEILSKIRPGKSEFNGDNYRLASTFMSNKKTYKELCNFLSKRGLDEDCIPAIATIRAAEFIDAADKCESRAISRREASLLELNRERADVVLFEAAAPGNVDTTSGRATSYDHDREDRSQ